MPQHSAVYREICSVHDKSRRSYAFVQRTAQWGRKLGRQLRSFAGGRIRHSYTGTGSLGEKRRQLLQPKVSPSFTGPIRTV